VTPPIWDTFPPAIRDELTRALSRLFARQVTPPQQPEVRHEPN
jgi:hypothetical protein